MTVTLVFTDGSTLKFDGLSSYVVVNGFFCYCYHGGGCHQVTMDHVDDIRLS